MRRRKECGLEVAKCLVVSVITSCGFNVINGNVQHKPVGCFVGAFCSTKVRYIHDKGSYPILRFLCLCVHGTA